MIVFTLPKPTMVKEWPSDCLYQTRFSSPSGKPRYGEVGRDVGPCRNTRAHGGSSPRIGVLSSALLNKGSTGARILGCGGLFSPLLATAWRLQRSATCEEGDQRGSLHIFPFGEHRTHHRNLILFLGQVCFSEGPKPTLWRGKASRHSSTLTSGRVRAGRGGAGRGRGYYISPRRSTRLWPHTPPNALASRLLSWRC